MYFILEREDNTYLKEVVFTGMGIRTTTDITKACQYTELEHALEDALAYEFNLQVIKDELSKTKDKS